jgi:hypothetical protein
MENVIFWDETPYGSSEELSASINRVTIIGELGTMLVLTANRSTLRSNTMCYVVFLRSVPRLVVTTDFRSSPIIVTLMMEVICSYEACVLTRTRRRLIPGGDILHINLGALNFPKVRGKSCAINGTGLLA